MPVRSRRLFLTALFAVSLLSGCALKKAAEGSQTASQKTAKPLQRKPSVNSENHVLYRYNLPALLKPRVRSR